MHYDNKCIKNSVVDQYHKIFCATDIFLQYENVFYLLVRLELTLTVVQDNEIHPGRLRPQHPV